MVRVSVIVPAFNEEKYISKCVNSLLEQTLKDIEIILVDDGSTDSTYKVMKNFSDSHENITAINLEHGGAGIARNRGLDVAKGEFVAFVDSDDILDKDSLERMYNSAINNNVPLVRCSYKTKVGPFMLGDFHNYLRLNEDHIIDTTIDKDYIVKESPSVGNKLISRELISKFRFGEGIKWEDLVFCPALMAEAKKIYYIKDALYTYRFHFSTTIRDRFKVIATIDDIFKVLELLESYMPDGYEDEYKSLYVIHILYRIQEISGWLSYPKKSKDELIQRFVDALSKKYQKWPNDNNVLDFVNNKKGFAKTYNRAKKYIR